ncbi:MAG: acyl carrier protein [Candidatus Krumholzibacteria bacterium]|nr:acyl carrier protein [Candidatus Krumholzibacteria bacterium]
MSRRGRLIHFLCASNSALAGDLTDDAPLISAGQLDSLAIFNLAVWIEKEVGQEIDLTTFDLGKEWDTVSGILNFIATHREMGNATS